MVSSRFFSFDPFDSYNAPYTYQQQPTTGRRATGYRWIDDTFPFAWDFEPEAPRAPANRKNRKPKEPKEKPISIRVDGPDVPQRERKAEGRQRAEPAARATEAPAVVARKRAPSPEAAAVRVQAAARGFLARKSVRAVHQVEREAEVVETIVREREEARRGNDRARIAAGELLMDMLLRLDAARGAREYRRRITRRVLALHDAVDALDPKAAPRHRIKAAADEIAEETEAAAADEATVVEIAEETAEETVEPTEHSDAAEHIGEIEVKAAAVMEVDGGSADGEPDAAEAAKPVSNGATLDADAEWEIVTEEPAAAPAAAASPEAPRQERAGQEITGAADAGAADGVDTGKLMEIVAALCERNAQQCALIGELVERVDALESTVRRMEYAERRAK